MPEGEPDEFAHIPSRRGRPPVLALAAVALAVFLAVRMRHDVGFAISSATPQDLGDARTLATQPIDALPLHRYVRLQGVPERESAVVLDTRGSWKFSQFFRLQGTGGRVFIRRAADPLPVPLAERDRFTGRLLRFRDLSFADSIARHFGNHVSATHFFRPPELAAALADRPASPSLRDLAGDKVTLAAGERLFIDVIRPGQYRLELPRDRFRERSRATQAVKERGATVIAERETPERWLLEVQIPDGDRDRVLSGLGDLDRAVRMRPARDTLEASVAELTAAPGQLVIRPQAGPERTVPLERIASVRTRAKVEIPPDAVLLIEGERPRSAWPSLVVLAFLLAFAAVNLLGLRRPA